MIGNSFLLDTNIISALLKGETTVADHIDRADIIFIPSIVLGELYYGAEYSTQIQKNLSNISLIAQSYEVLSVDEQTALHYGKIKAQLRKQGTPIPENDIWIAALSIQYQLELVTRDGHFYHIENLPIVKW